MKPPDIYQRGVQNTLKVKVRTFLNIAISCKSLFNKSSLEIIDSAKTDFTLKLKAMHIRWGGGGGGGDPNLNIQQKHVPVSIQFNSIQLNNNNNKIINIIKKNHKIQHNKSIL